MGGLVEVISGCMYSGKTEELIRRLTRARIARQNLIVFKPNVDNRYSIKSIVTHMDTRFPCVSVASAEDMLQCTTGMDVVGIDEAQFFGPGVLSVVEELVDKGIRVIVAGLDMDSDGKPFGPMPQLLAMADHVTKVNAVCTVCGENASRSQRMVDTQGQVLVGSTGLYEARCRNHWSTSLPPRPTTHLSPQLLEVPDNLADWQYP